MTNSENIRAMTDDELAKFLNELAYGQMNMWHGHCDVCDGDKENRCWECTAQWLANDVDDDE